MAKGTWSATATTSTLVAADANRRTLVVQLVSGDPVSIGIGEAAVFGEGAGMIAEGDYISLGPNQAQQAINGICDSGNSASGGYQTT